MHTPCWTFGQRVHEFIEVERKKFRDNDIVISIRGSHCIGFELTRPHSGFQVCESTGGCIGALMCILM